jgi:argininosuccinate lyase
VKKRRRATARAGRPKKAWSGRFREETAPEVERFTESVSFDRRLYRQDILGSIAHVRMLAHRKILPAAEARRIEKGLREIAREVEQGRFRFSSRLEDVHMNVEAALTEKIGEAGARLHTGRSRNDQVALDMRLYLREVIDEVREGLLRLQEVLLDRAEETLEVLLPGYTHLQKAQPVRLAHHLLAYHQMFSRDEQRMFQLRERVDVMPLGAGAIAGSGYPVDPGLVARLLGFSGVAANSMDAVSDRDFAIEFCFSASMILLHLSRWSEELILWSSEGFGFVELSDAYCTGSSMMPQKKNPDVLELIRGKTGGVYGDLHALLVLMKGLPLTYQRDMQEDKVPLFHAADTVKACLSVFPLLLETVRFQTDRMRAEAEQGFLNATDLADELARKGMPFRRAHAVAGRAVRYCMDRGKRLEDLTGAEWKALAPEAGPGIRRVLSIERVVEARNVPGGTARSQVRKQLRRARAEVGQRRGRLERDKTRSEVLEL